jgi:hypothetical protein
MNLVTLHCRLLSSLKLVSLTYSLHSQYLVHSTLLVPITSVAPSPHVFIPSRSKIPLLVRKLQLANRTMENSVLLRDYNKPEGRLSCYIPSALVSRRKPSIRHLAYPM